MSGSVLVSLKERVDLQYEWVMLLLGGLKEEAYAARYPSDLLYLLALLGGFWSPSP